MAWWMPKPVGRGLERAGGEGLETTASVDHFVDLKGRPAPTTDSIKK